MQGQTHLQVQVRGPWWQALSTTSVPAAETSTLERTSFLRPPTPRTHAPWSSRKLAQSAVASHGGGSSVAKATVPAGASAWSRWQALSGGMHLLDAAFASHRGAATSLLDQSLLHMAAAAPFQKQPHLQVQVHGRWWQALSTGGVPAAETSMQNLLEAASASHHGAATSLLDQLDALYKAAAAPLQRQSQLQLKVRGPGSPPQECQRRAHIPGYPP